MDQYVSAIIIQLIKGTINDRIYVTSGVSYTVRSLDLKTFRMTVLQSQKLSEVQSNLPTKVK